MTDKLLECVLKGRFENFDSLARWSSLPKACVQTTEDGFFYYASGIDFPTCNGILGNEDRSLSDREIEQGVQFFKKHDLPFVWWTSSKNLEEKGFHFGGKLTGIALELSHEISKLPPAPHIHIRRVESSKDMKVFSELFIQLFGMERNTVEEFQKLFTALRRHSGWFHFLATYDKKPVSIVSLSISNSSAGLWNLATLPEYRGRGIGTMVIHHALREAQRRKCSHIMAILMPKAMAWNLMKKFGFQTVCHFPFYIYGMQADQLEV